MNLHIESGYLENSLRTAVQTRRAVLNLAESGRATVEQLEEFERAGRDIAHVISIALDMQEGAS